MTTKAGKRVLVWERIHTYDCSGVPSCSCSARDDIAAIEAEAVAAERARIAEGVRGLDAHFGDAHPHLHRAAVLAVIEEKP